MCFCVSVCSVCFVVFKCTVRFNPRITIMQYRLILYNNATLTLQVQHNGTLHYWYFCNKLKDFINHWLLKVLDVDWYWYHCEYQAHGSTHAHGCAKLKNDPNLCSLVKTAAAGWVAEQQQQQNDAGNYILISEYYLLLCT